MWKLVKTELSYFKIPIIITWSLFITLSLVAPLIARRNPFYNGIESYFAALTGWIIFYHMVLNIAFMYFETRESRVRLQSMIPVSRINVGLSRIATPFLLMVQTLLLIVSCLLIYLFIFKQWHGWTEFFLHDKLILLPVWVIVTYLVRMLSEWQGRLFLIVGFVIVMLYQTVLPVFYIKLVWILEIFASEHILIWPNILYVLTAVVPVLWAFLFVSFIRRRSFLA